MDLLAFIIGIAVLLLLGWVMLLLLERTSPVLGSRERWFWALILGPTAFALLAFLCHIAGLTSLSLFGFLMPSITLVVLLTIVGIRCRAFRARSYRPTYAPSMALPRYIKFFIIILTVWTAIKLLAGAFDLVSVPTYWDDSFNNWNMRGKMFFQTQRLTLEIPIGNGIVQSSTGVGSYPPTVPLLKTWLSDLRGSWEEPLVNGLHLIWLVGLIGVFYHGLKRKLSPMLSLGGTYLLVSLPSLLIQATNPYADIFMASHVLLGMLCLFHMSEEKDAARFRTWIKVFGFTLGLMFFTKNEATVLYAPALFAMFVWVLIEKKKTGLITGNHLRKFLAQTLMVAALLAAPWILFKWSHGLTFGNAKSVGGMTLSLNTKVIQAIWYHLTHEANWLLLPLVCPVVIALSGKHAFTLPEGVLTVFLMLVISLQFLIFIFTPLATEAIMQTGLGRGLLHIAPVAMLLTIVLTEKLLRRE